MTSIYEHEQLDVGAQLVGPERVVTAERLRWYGDGLLTAAAGKRTFVGSNIHTDEEYAREQGLSAPIADGMLSTNWISAMLLRCFGHSYLATGELRTKYVKPVPVGTTVRVLGLVRDRSITDRGRVRYELDVWTEDGDGTKLVDGEAAIEIVD